MTPEQIHAELLNLEAERAAKQSELDAILVDSARREATADPERDALWWRLKDLQGRKEQLQGRLRDLELVADTEPAPPPEDPN